MRALLAAALLIVACDSPSPMTWRDAYTEYSSRWCENTSACAPGWFTVHYDSQDACVAESVDEYCADREYCDDTYPGGAYARVLRACLEDQKWWPCGEWFGPITCFEAFP